MHLADTFITCSMWTNIDTQSIHETIPGWPTRKPLWKQSLCL